VLTVDVEASTPITAIEEEVCEIGSTPRAFFSSTTDSSAARSATELCSGVVVVVYTFELRG
jgi:hypothetical protein